MRLVEIIFTSPAAGALGWALVHSLWQGALVGLLLAAALRLLRGRAANARYAAACAALALMLVLPAATFLRQSGTPRGAEVDEASLQTPPPSESESVSGRAGRTAGLNDDASERTGQPARRGMLKARLAPVLPWLVMAWLLGVCGLTARVCGGLWYARRLTRRQTRTLGLHWQGRLGQLSKRLRLRRAVRLLESSLVRVPTTVGWLRPVVLLPASAFTGLTPQQLELILAHELAHIRRHDYLVNLFQVLVETLLFYHPAAWWVSARVRAEREHACDDMAVAVCGDVVAYARALTQVERLRREKPLLAVAADGGDLRGRVLRLIENPQGARGSSPALTGLLLVAAVLTIVAGAHGVLSQKRQGAAAERLAAEARGPSVTESSRNHSEAGERPAEVVEAATLIARDETDGEDAETRRAALLALGGRAGAVIVMDPRTGRVYTVVNQEWAVRRSLMPASMIKLVTGAAGVGEKALEKPGRGSAAADAKALDLTAALARSDNAYFGRLGESVGAERLVGYAREFGLGELTGVNYAGESAGLVPPSFAGGDASRLGAYGEGIEATPMQLATLVSAIANGGSLVVPRVPREGTRFEPQVRRRLRLPRESIERLIPGMVGAVKYGTGRAASVGSQKVAGKTGSYVDEQTPVGIFASYAPADDPRLVVVVVTRGQNESGPVAAGVAGEIYRALDRRR